jgi:cytochrome P450
MSSAVFAGPELAVDPDWQHLILTYTINFFKGVRALRTWPGFLRPVIHWVLPECVVCRQQLVRAKKIIDPVVLKRRNERSAALAEGREPEKHNDAIEWMEQEAATASNKGLSVSSYEPAAAQLGLAIAAMHTTTELISQVLVDICRSEQQQPDVKVIHELRKEVEEAVAESGWTTAGIFKMRLLDSVIKETQRLKPGSVVNLERKVMRDTRLPDGTVLLKGEVIGVDTSAMWDETVFPEPEKWDAWRFYNLRGGTEKGESSAQLVSSNTEHFAFGLGKSICPGRFMVAHEVKVAIAAILLEYDVRLAEGCDPKVFNYGFEMLADPSTMLDVRRRT